MSRASASCFGRLGKSEHCRFEPSPGLITDFKIDTCHILARHSALLGYFKDWLAHGQDNVTEWDGMVSQWDYKVAMSAQSQVGTRPGMTLDVART